MSPTVRVVLHALEAIAPAAKAASWDQVGLQVGDFDASADRIGVCHEVTHDIVDRIVAERLDLVVAYHPLLFRPTTRFVAGSGAGGRAFRLARAGVAVAVAHTNFDVAAGGCADALGDAIGLTSARGFAPVWGADTFRVVTYVPESSADPLADAMAAAGAGRVGGYTGCAFRSQGMGRFTAPVHAAPAVGRPGATNEAPETRLEMTAPAALVDAVVAALVAAHPYEEPVYDVLDRRGDAGFVGRVGDLAAPRDLDDYAREVASRLGGVVRVAGSGSVRRVAVIPGSGGDFLHAARASGADVVVTGDVHHHAAQAACEQGMSVIDPGHAATERPGVQRLYAAVAAEYPGAVDLTDDPDPWRPA